MKASEHILEGCKTVKEYRYVHMNRPHPTVPAHGCVLGTGAINALGHDAAYQALVNHAGSCLNALADVLKLPHGVAKDAEDLHLMGFSREQIARWMAEAGY